MANQDGITKEVVKSTITVSRVYESPFQKEDTMTAELKQVITTFTTYPSKRVSNSIDGNIFDVEDFGFDNNSAPFENIETRVAWIDVPVGTSVEQVVAKLANFPNACLYRIMDNQPIISDNQQNAIEDPARANITLDTFADRQAVRYPNGHDNAGKLAIHTSGKVQYRRVAFSATAHADVDNRNADADYGYVSETLKAEMSESPATIVAEQVL